ncbi:MAG TPA: hypothetical protein VFG68_18695, partial [Fimbriiglobus sp.]|nr:hypothetical protein [Fimbriiglobus sp.]
MTHQGNAEARKTKARSCFRHWWGIGGAFVILAVAASPAAAQRPRVKIADVKVGLPPGRYVGERDAAQRGSPVAKRNTWAPVYVRLEMIRKVEQGGVQLKVETVDADDLRTTLMVPLLRTLADRNPGEMIEPAEFAYVPYVRCGDRGGQVTLTVMSAVPGEEPDAISESIRLGTGGNFIPFRDTATYVVLSLGSTLPGFELPQEDRKGPQSGTTRGGLRGGRVETAALTNVREMPDQWFGYQAADLVVLTTGATQGEFLDELFDREKSVPFKDRRDALLEWVRRGGKLVVSVGSNASKVAPSELFQDILPARIKADPPTRDVAELPLRWQTTGVGPVSQPLAPKREGDKFKVAQLVLTPAKPARVLIPQPADARDDPARAELPAVVQAPYGLGRVTVVAFDLDQSPFADYPRKAQFWDWLIRNAGSEKAALAVSQPANQYGYGITDTEDEYAAALRQHIDTFEGVPVISFGWVALFIVLYTLLIGPVEYLFLKKVLGRLELTWITFPVIVLSVSAAAYFTAYAIKGNDLKLNKVDVVDVDLAGGRVYGRTWLTVFSPRIDSYTISVEPKENWAVARPDGPSPQPLVDWMGGGRGGGSSFLSRGYSYHVDPDDRVMCDGLVRVPIQVWSTKAFTANWSGYIDKGTPPIAADLYHPTGDEGAVIGTFVNNLPVRSLRDPVLFYAGQAYKLDTLTPGQRVTIPATGGQEGRGLPADKDWVANNASVNVTGLQSGYNQWGGRPAPTATSSSLSLWGLLFHEAGTQREARLTNATMRPLDQSWRLDPDNRNQAILAARVETANGLTTDILGDPAGPSPTRLWLKGLPQPGATPPVIPGTLRQET